MAKWSDNLKIHQSTEKPPAWKRLSSGQYVDLNNFTEKDVNITDIEYSLNHIIRFTGHGKNLRPLTVAQHSLLCCELAKEEEPDNFELQLRALSHDFAEAYIGDVATPVKKVMGEAWHQFARPIEQTVELALIGSLASEAIRVQVKIYDAISLDIERRSIWRDQTGKDKWPKLVSTKTLNEKLDRFRWAASYEYVPLTELFFELKEKHDFTLQAKSVG